MEQKHSRKVYHSFLL